jgi:hypothetical protein
VLSRNLEQEEAKARYRAVKIQPQWVVTPGKQTCNGPTNALVCNKTLIQMSHIKTFKITPTCFDHQLIIIGELLDPS